MECHIAGVMRCSDKHLSWFSWPSSNMDLENIHTTRYNVGFCSTGMNSRSLTFFRQVAINKYSKLNSSGRTFSTPINLNGKPSSSTSSSDYMSSGDEISSEGLSDNIMSQKLGIDELKSVLADSQRTKLINKLSEANQHNRFLKRQLQIKDDAMVNFKRELAVMELEIQALATLAEEVAKSGIPQGSRKINGKYVQSHLFSRLEALRLKLKEQVKDVDIVQSKEVPIFWFGVAESVQVMGSFDGWSQGEHLSPEYSGSFSKFSTILMLRRGRYEIKFLVDGEWKLSPELPTTGEGMMKNNLLIVE